MKKFNVRVYFLILRDGYVLASDELIKGEKITKFPGGGLEWGEGVLDGLRREAMEELGQSIRILSHFYTTEFFIQSYYNPNDQILSIYYKAELEGEPKFRTSTERFDFSADTERESFRWIKISELRSNEFSFPADQETARRLFDEQERQRYI